MIEAEKQAQISKIQYEQKIMEKESVQRMEKIENKIQSDRLRSQADNELYIAQQQVNKLNRITKLFTFLLIQIHSST